MASYRMIQGRGNQCRGHFCFDDRPKSPTYVHPSNCGYDWRDHPATLPLCLAALERRNWSIP
jgi:hypothetical protein